MNIKTLLGKLADPLMYSVTKCLVDECNIKHRVVREDADKSIQTVQHLVDSIQLINKTAPGYCDLLSSYYDEIYYFLHHEHNFECLFSSKKIAISVPYYFNLDDEDQKWYQGLTACMLVRIAHVTKIINTEEGDDLSNIRKIIKQVAYNNEKEFAAKLGESWEIFYNSDDLRQMPLIYPGGY